MCEAFCTSHLPWVVTDHPDFRGFLEELNRAERKLYRPVWNRVLPPLENRDTGRKRGISSALERYHLVLEDLDGGDLFDRIEQNGPYKEEEAALLMRQVVTAVDYLHAKGIVHRDLKPDNLVFTTKAPDARMKIIDFGYAGFCSASAPLRGLCGTPDYAAPEILTW